MADTGPIFTSESLQQVLDKLNDVLTEAARLRKEVMRQLGEQRASQLQHVSSSSRKRKGRVSATRAR